MGAFGTIAGAYPSRRFCPSWPKSAWCPLAKQGVAPAVAAAVDAAAQSAAASEPVGAAVGDSAPAGPHLAGPLDHLEPDDPTWAPRWKAGTEAPALHDDSTPRQRLQGIIDLQVRGAVRWAKLEERLSGRPWRLILAERIEVLQDEKLP